MGIGSTWWEDRGRIHVSSSFGHIGLVPLSEEQVIAVDGVLADVLERIRESGDHDPKDFQYLFLGQSFGIAGRPPRVHLKVEFFQSLDRILVEHVELHQRHFFVRADQALECDLGLEAQLLDQSIGKLIKLSSGVFVVHRRVSFLDRLKIRARSAARDSLIDDLVAVQSRCAARSEPAGEAA